MTDDEFQQQVSGVQVTFSQRGNNNGTTAGHERCEQATIFDSDFGLGGLIGRIRKMNRTFHRMPHQDEPTGLAHFKDTINEEFEELADLVLNVKSRGEFTQEDKVALADWLADVIVYCLSESQKFHIPIEAVLHAVMDSQHSKLDDDGKPIIDHRGKFLKSENYQPPEPRILEILTSNSCYG